MLKNHNTCCVLFYDNTKYDELANLGLSQDQLKPLDDQMTVLNTDLSKAEAKLENGLLEITIPTSEKAKPKVLKIK